MGGKTILEHELEHFKWLNLLKRTLFMTLLKKQKNIQNALFNSFHIHSI